MVCSKGPTWRIIPTSEWLITTVCKSLPNGLNGLYMAVTNHLLSGMILQVRMTPRCLQAVTVKDMKKYSNETFTSFLCLCWDAWKR